MGYSWSSAVAQDVSLGLLRAAGFDEEQVLCVEQPPPLRQDEVMCVLTDDCVMAHVLAPAQGSTRGGLKCPPKNASKSTSANRFTRLSVSRSN